MLDMFDQWNLHSRNNVRSQSGTVLDNFNKTKEKRKPYVQVLFGEREVPGGKLAIPPVLCIVATRRGPKGYMVVACRSPEPTNMQVSTSGLVGMLSDTFNPHVLGWNLVQVLLQFTPIYMD